MDVLLHISEGNEIFEQTIALFFKAALQLFAATQN